MRARRASGRSRRPGRRGLHPTRGGRTLIRSPVNTLRQLSLLAVVVTITAGVFVFEAAAHEPVLGFAGAGPDVGYAASRLPPHAAEGFVQSALESPDADPETVVDTVAIGSSAAFGLRAHGAAGPRATECSPGPIYLLRHAWLI